MAIIEQAFEALLTHRRADGAYGLFAEGSTRPDAAAWAILAGASRGQSDEALDPSRRSLTAFQAADGSVGVAPSHRDSYWPTALSILAWAGADAYRGNLGQAAKFLAEHRAPTIPDEPITGHDETLPGWNWIKGTSPWLAPTAWAVLALDAARIDAASAVAGGVALILNRQLPAGGWNYGNTTVFGHELPPMPESTGLALTALAGRASVEAVRRSLDYAETQARHLRSPSSLGWLVLALDAWGRRPAEAGRWIEESLRRQTDIGPYSTNELATLLIASNDAWTLPGVRKGA